MSRMFPLVLVMLLVATAASAAAAAPSKQDAARGPDGAAGHGRASPPAHAAEAAPPGLAARAAEPPAGQERARAEPPREEAARAGQRVDPPPASSTPAQKRASAADGPKPGASAVPADVVPEAWQEAAPATGADGSRAPADVRAAAADSETRSSDQAGRSSEGAEGRQDPSSTEDPSETRGAAEPPVVLPRTGPAVAARQAAEAEIAAARVARPVTEDAESRRSLAAAAGALGVGLVTAGAAHLSRRTLPPARAAGAGGSAGDDLAEPDPPVVDVREALTRGQRAVAAGAYESASRWFDRALALDPRLAVAHFCQGLCLAELGRHEEAYAAFHAAYALDPQEATFRVHLARACVRLERQGEAMDMLAPVVAALPELGEAALQDETLEPLRDHPRFLAMTGAL